MFVLLDLKYHKSDAKWAQQRTNSQTDVAIAVSDGTYIYIVEKVVIFHFKGNKCRP